MEYFSKALGSLNIGLPFTVVPDERVSLPHQTHEITQAVWKKDSAKVSVLSYSLKDPLDLEKGRNATSVLRRLKIPGVARHVDSIETFDRLFLVIERVSAFDFATMSESAAKFVAFSVINTLKTMFEAANYVYHQDLNEIVQARSGLPVLAVFDSARQNPEGEAGAAFTARSCLIMTAAEFASLIDMVFVAHPQLRSQLMTKAGISSGASLGTSKLNIPRILPLLETPVTDMVAQLDGAVLLGSDELADYCARIEQLASDLWPGLIQGSVLPQLVRTKNPVVLRTVLKLLKYLQPELFTDSEPILNYMEGQYSSMDRVVRLELLKSLPSYIELMPPTFVQTKIMPKMSFGFVDSEVVMRRASVASVEILAAKLSSRQLNTELLRLLAKTHNDTDSDVRALTTTVLCKIAPLLDNRAVVSTALGRALKDPVAKCRGAALQSVLEINVPAKEIAEKLLGPAAVGMLDKDTQVSAEAWRVTNALLARIQEESTAKGPSKDVTNTDTSVDHIVSEAMPVSSSMTKPAPPSLSRPRFGATQEQVSPEPTDKAVESQEVVEEDAWDWEEEEEAQDADAPDVEDAWEWDE